MENGLSALNQVFNDIATVLQQYGIQDKIKPTDFATKIEQLVQSKSGNGEIARYKVDQNGNATQIAGDLVFDGLKSIDYKALFECFFDCYDINSTTFPNLTSIGPFGMRQCFYSCSNLSSVSFPSLSSIDQYGMWECFSGCENLSSVSFPSLTSIGSYGMSQCFDSCSNLREIHFRVDAKSVVESTEGYVEKFGASNATIYFDL